MTSGPHPPEDPQAIVDARFRDIVASFAESNSGSNAADGPEQEPEQEGDGSGDGRDAGNDAARRGSESRNGVSREDPPRTAGGSRAPEPTPWRVHHPPEDLVEERFVPPRPAPPPGQDAVFWTAFVGCVAGPLWFIYLVLTDPYGSRVGLWAAGLLTLCGCALIVWRLPKGRDNADDDGARV